MSHSSRFDLHPRGGSQYDCRDDAERAIVNDAPAGYSYEIVETRTYVHTTDKLACPMTFAVKGYAKDGRFLGYCRFDDPAA